MKRFLFAGLVLTLFLSGFISGYLYNSFYSKPEVSPSVVSNTDNSDQPINDIGPCDKNQQDVRSMLMHASNVISQLESDNAALSYQIKKFGFSLNSDSTESDLLSRIDRLPETLINQQLEMLFDNKYLEGIDDKKAFAKKIIEIALAEVEDDTIDIDTDENTYIEIIFSLSPVTGIRRFYTISELEVYDTIFAHFTTATVYPNLIARWEHAGTGEILRMGPLTLQDSQNGYLSLKPKSGWKPGYYRVSLFDIDNNQKVVGSSRYLVDNVIDTENQASDIDQDVINDLRSNGFAVPKLY
jgi:hypothetical protein